MQTPLRVALLTVLCGLLIGIAAGCPIRGSQGDILVFNETDEEIELRYRDEIIGSVPPGGDGLFNPRPAQDGDCLIAPLEILNEAGQVIEQVNAGECYDRNIEVHVTDE